MTSSEATVDPALDFDRIELSAFPHARTATPRPKPVTLAQFLDTIEHGRYAKVVEQARTLYAQYKAGQIDKSVYQTFKERRLEAVTMARFHTKRQARYLRMHHGLVVGDADDLDDPDAIRTRLQDDPHVVAMFLSPGGSGLKIIARIPPQDAAGHRRAFHAFADYLGARYGVILDRRGQDVNRLCYISADPHVYRNPAAVPLILPAQTRSQTHRRTGEKPGDALNTTADAVWWQDLLERHGWAVADAEPPDHHVTYWTRPGKDAGVSASLGFHPPNSNEQLWLYVWTDRAAPLSPGWHSPFQAYTLLEHQGDFTAAAQILAQDAAADAQRRTNGAHTKEQSWESPTPLPSLLPDVPTLPEQLLPAPFKRWLCDIAERFQIPLEYVAIPAVIALAAIVGRRCGVRPMRRDDWLVVPNLWGMIVGRPGVLKSPAMEEALRPLKRLATRAREQYEQAKIEAGSHDAVREARRDAIHAHLKQNERRRLPTRTRSLAPGTC